MATRREMQAAKVLMDRLECACESRVHAQQHVSKAGTHSEGQETEEALRKADEHKELSRLRLENYIYELLSTEEKGR